MTNTSSGKTALSSSWIRDDRVDFVALALLLWHRRAILVAATVLMGATFYATSFALREEYESTILLLPTETPKLDQLGAAAALLGKKASTGSADLELYQTLLTSRTVTSQLLRTGFANRHDTGSGRVEPLFRILGIDTSDPGELYAAERDLATSIEVGSVGTGLGNILQVTLKAPHPWLARDLAEQTVSIGQEAFRKVRIERSETILSRLVVASEAARRDWDEAARKASQYKEQHRSISLPELQYDLDRILMEKQLKEQKYVLARREVEQLALEQAKAAPPAMILDKATTPPWRTRPKRALLAIVGMVLGAAGSCAAVLAWSLLGPELRKRA